MCCRHKKVNLKEWQTKDIIHFASPLHFSSPLYIQWVSLLFLMRLSFLFSNYSYTFFNLNIFPSSLPSFSPPSSISDCSFYSFLSCLLSLCLFTFLFFYFSLLFPLHIFLLLLFLIFPPCFLSSAPQSIYYSSSISSYYSSFSFPSFFLFSFHSLCNHFTLATTFFFVKTTGLKRKVNRH